MIVDQNAWVFDTGPLRHFAAQQWLSVIRFLAGDRPIVIPESVEWELENAAEDYLVAARQILDADWIHVHRTSDLEYSQFFAGYEERLVVERKNLGECGVLAMGKRYGCEVVIDDATPRGMAEAEGLRVTATVQILCEAIRAKQLTTPMVEHLADTLIEGKYFLPFKSGGFRAHVLENGLLDYDEL